jgi:hypothetical protein
MSTDYYPLAPIRMADLFDGRLEDVGVREQHSEDTTSDLKCLTDGRNFLLVYGDEKGLVSSFTRRGMNAPQRILQAISDEFDVRINTISRCLRPIREQRFRPNRSSA